MCSPEPLNHAEIRLRHGLQSDDELTHPAMRSIAQRVATAKLILRIEVTQRPHWFAEKKANGTSPQGSDEPVPRGEALTARIDRPLKRERTEHHFGRAEPRKKSRSLFSVRTNSRKACTPNRLTMWVFASPNIPLCAIACDSLFPYSSNSRTSPYLNRHNGY